MQTFPHCALHNDPCEKKRRIKKKEFGSYRGQQNVTQTHLHPLYNQPISAGSKHSPKWTTKLKGQAGTDEISGKYSTIKGGLRETMTKPCV